VSSGRNAIYISILSVFWVLLNCIIHVSGFMWQDCEQKEVGLYEKYDYYLICIENLVRSCGVVI
jgi:hypothetical protein